MNKLFLGISWKSNPLFGVTLNWANSATVDCTVVLFGLELLGIQFKKSKE